MNTKALNIILSVSGIIAVATVIYIVFFRNKADKNTIPQTSPPTSYSGNISLGGKNYLINNGKAYKEVSGSLSVSDRRSIV